MSYEIIATPRFRSELKKLSKKFPSLKQEFIDLVNLLSSDPNQGVSLGHHCFKIRLAIASKGRGKSGGSRIITCVKIHQNRVFLLSIFDKSDRESISDTELQNLLSAIE